MYSRGGLEYIRVLVADDDAQVLECYVDAFSEDDPNGPLEALDALASELFESSEDIEVTPKFDLVVCTQGEEAVEKTERAIAAGEPFDVVILDIRMPPGIDGVETGSRIRVLDNNAEIIFVSGFSDIPFHELLRRVPPPNRLHYFNKPLSFTQLASDVIALLKP